MSPSPKEQPHYADPLACVPPLFFPYSLNRTPSHQQKGSQELAFNRHLAHYRHLPRWETKANTFHYSDPTPWAWPSQIMKPNQKILSAWLLGRCHLHKTRVQNPEDHNRRWGGSWGKGQGWILRREGWGRERQHGNVHTGENAFLQLYVACQSRRGIQLLPGEAKGQGTKEQAYTPVRRAPLPWYLEKALVRGKLTP